MDIYKISTGKHLVNAIFEDRGNIKNSDEYVSAIIIDGITYESITPKTEVALFTYKRYVTDMHNFMEWDLSIEL